jgi:hypothetical protein
MTRPLPTGWRGVGHVGSVSRDEGNYLARPDCHEPGAVSHPILSSPAARDIAARALSMERGTSIGELHALWPTAAPAPATATG